MAKVKLVATLTYTVDDFVSLKEEKEMFKEFTDSYNVDNKKVKVEKAK